MINPCIVDTDSSDDAQPISGLIWNHPFDGMQSDDGSAVVLCKMCGIMPKVAAVPWVGKGHCCKLV